MDTVEVEFTVDQAEQLKASSFSKFLTFLAKRFEIGIEWEDKGEPLLGSKGRDQLSTEQMEKLKYIYLFSLVFGRPELLYRVKVTPEGDVFINLGDFSREERVYESWSGKIYSLFITADDREVRQKLEEEFGLKLDPQGELERGFRKRLASLMPEEILQGLKEAGFPKEKVGILLRNYLRRREAWLGYLSQRKGLEEDSIWEDFDRILTDSPGNIFGLIEGEFERAYKSLEELEHELEGFRQKDNFISKVLRRKERKEREEKIERLISSLQRAIGNMEEVQSNTFLRRRGGGVKNSYLLDRYYYVTREQIEEMKNFGNRIEKLVQLLSHDSDKKKDVEALIREYRKFLESIMNCRVEFEQACKERGRALVSHVTSPEAMERIVREGEIKSSLYQQVNEGKTIKGSPYTERYDLLAQVAFAVDGADLTYCKTQKDRAVALVAPYPVVARRGIFVEYPSTSWSPYVYSSEFHLFNKVPGEGAVLPVDIFYLCVPEKERQRWEDFLLRQKNEGGAGKDKAWVEQHLITYPSDEIPLDVFLRYFFKVEPTEERGAFIATDKEVLVHKFQGKEDKLRAFRWIDAPHSPNGHMELVRG